MSTNTETRIAYLRPAQVQERLAAAPVAYVPVGPLEWHGPHLPFGVDPLHAERLARAACERTGGIVWQTVFFGTERERTPDMLASLGFDRDDYIVGMDFPGNPLPSAYCPEEVFGILVREVLRAVRAMGARLAMVVNGHGGVNHLATLRRLATEITRTTDLTVLGNGLGAPPGPSKDAASGGHADAGETSLMMHLFPDTVDLGALPPAAQPIRYADYAIVDGVGFDGKGRPDHVLQNDPRTKATAERGQDAFARSLERLAKKVTAALGELQ